MVDIPGPTCQHDRQIRLGIVAPESRVSEQAAKTPLRDRRQEREEPPRARPRPPSPLRPNISAIESSKPYLERFAKSVKATYDRTDGVCERRVRRRQLGRRARGQSHTEHPPLKSSLRDSWAMAPVTLN